MVSFTPRPSDVQFELDLAAAQAMQPVIDRTFTPDEIVEAHRDFDTGRKCGNILLRVS